MKAVFQEATVLAEQGVPFVTATVVHTKGSTPQKPGAMLLVRADGSTVGTLGGGCVEGDIWFAAKEALREGSGPLYKDYFLNEDIAARDGLVCGGSMFFFIEPVMKAGAFTSLAQEVTEAYEGGPSLAVATLVHSQRLPLGNRLIVREDGSTTGTLGDPALDAQATAHAQEVMPLGKSHRLTTSAGDEVFIEGFTSPATLLLIGGGHVNLAVAQIAHMLGFQVMVTDDRREFADKERFPMAEEVWVAPYDHSLDGHAVAPNTAIVVATRGHRFDDMALEAAARTPARYVGLIGSKRKTILIYEALLKRGVPLERVKSIHAPIGLDIGGREPREIAVSIMAEIIAWRYNGSGAPMKLEEERIDRIHQKITPTAVH